MTQYGVIVMQSCMDQGDTSSPDWLDLKALIGTQGYHLIPIKFAFALLTHWGQGGSYLAGKLRVC